MADNLSDEIAGLVVNLRLVAAWRKPGGATPKIEMPNNYTTCTAAATLLETLAVQITELEAKLTEAERKGFDAGALAMRKRASELSWSENDLAEIPFIDPATLEGRP